MSSAEVKRVETRISLKYDTYTNWTDESTAGKGAHLKLLKGEIGFCEIPTGSSEATNAPTILFKVGDGEHTFKQLNWASATAADVYGWAKAQEVVLDGEVLKFKTGDTTIASVDLSSFATDSVVSALEARLAAVEDNFTGDDSVAATFTGILERLDIIEGNEDTEGSINKAKKDVKAYADAQDEVAKTAAINASKEYTNTEVSKLNAEDARLAALINDNATLISTETSNRTAADNAINDKIGGNYDATNTVAAAINKVATDLNTLKTGDVNTNTENISKVTADLASEISNREAADTAFETRMQAVEAFFAGADHDGETGGLKDALDTLVEIQEYLDGDGSASGQLIDQVNQNSDDIESLQNSMSSTEADVASIKADYLKAADILILDCGSSTLVIEDPSTTVSL